MPARRELTMRQIRQMLRLGLSRWDNSDRFTPSERPYLHP